MNRKITNLNMNAFNATKDPTFASSFLMIATESILGMTVTKK